MLNFEPFENWVIFAKHIAHLKAQYLYIRFPFSIYLIYDFILF